MYLPFTANLLYFLSDLNALYILRSGPNFYENHPYSRKFQVMDIIIWTFMAAERSNLQFA
jgi:hypothetical protein